MKKKFSVLLATLVLALAMGTSAMAAVSPYIVAPEIIELEKGQINNAEYRTLFNVFGAWLSESGRFITSVGDGSALAAEMNEAALQIVELYAGITGYKTADVIAFMNVSAKNVTAEMWNAGVKVSLMDVPATGYEEFVVLHIKSDGNLELIPNYVEKGRIVGKFHSLSPVVVIGLKGTSGAGASVDATATDSTGAAVKLEVAAGNALAGANAAEAKEYNALFKTWQDEQGEKALADLAEQLKAGQITEKAYREQQSEILTKCLKETVSRHSQVKFDTIQWYGEANISLTDGGAMPKGGLDITIRDPQIKKGTTMILLHIKEDGTVEEIRNLKVTDGAITGHFNSLSPVVYFEVTSRTTSAGNQTGVQQPASGGQTGAQGSGSTNNAASPKTGEHDMTALAVLVALMAAGGVAYLGRRRCHA
ncbi:MAG: LPXTG cell wall anchor domain-containing protein [Lachnospiraceae bacterium]|nr:LPXTG cell wall anchor domain-containing protein [Lachnospiraceae bacterium]MCI9151775.1 LPXTG cell wall anchor domain-containing protein [Lachnospiraceae bacterium]